jgi:hypothetical protein
LADSKHYESIDNVLVFYNIFKIVSDNKRFIEWYKTNYGSVDNQLFEGYKFFIIVSYRCLVDAVVHDSAMGLDEDNTLSS